MMDEAYERWLNLGDERFRAYRDAEMLAYAGSVYPPSAPTFVAVVEAMPEDDPTARPILRLTREFAPPASVTADDMGRLVVVDLNRSYTRPEWVYARIETYRETRVTIGETVVEVNAEIRLVWVDLRKRRSGNGIACEWFTVADATERMRLRYIPDDLLTVSA